MSYEYGMQGFPAVGNGLGGLPRRKCLTTSPTVETDPYFSSVSLLLHGDGDLLDSSSSPKTITAYGNAAASDVQRKFGDGSIYFDGKGDYLSSANNAAFNFGTGDFTIEWWMYCNVAWSSMTNPGIAGQKAGDTSAGWQIYRNSVNNIDKVNVRVGISGTASDFHSNAAPATSVWEHWALTRQSGMLRWFKNGALTASYTVTTNVSDATGNFNVGYTQVWGGYFNGYIDELRITNGVARYTAAFTPPDKAFPNA